MNLCSASASTLHRSAVAKVNVIVKLGGRHRAKRNASKNAKHTSAASTAVLKELSVAACSHRYFAPFHHVRTKSGRRRTCQTVQSRIPAEPATERVTRYIDTWSQPTPNYPRATSGFICVVKYHAECFPAPTVIPMLATSYGKSFTLTTSTMMPMLCAFPVKECPSVTPQTLRLTARVQGRLDRRWPL
jgi:hypothetical protein